MIVSIGEVLWDYIGNERFIGGAPLNVSYYLMKSGIDVKFVSKVGNDDNGKKIIEKIEQLGLNSDIQIDEVLQTGRVNVFRKQNNDPDYDIIENVAWDNISFPEINEDYHLVFGTLAQRNKVSRNTIRQLRNNAKLKFYDVNLRKTCTKELVLESLEVADIVKLNSEELFKIYGWLFIDHKESDLEQKASEVRNKYGLKALAVTLGEDGAFVTTGDSLHRVKGIIVNEANSTGCGDAFFGTLIAGYLKNMDWQKNLEKANQVASCVASIKGAIKD